MSYEDKNIFQAPAKDILGFSWKLLTFCIGFYVLLDYVFQCKIKTYQGFSITFAFFAVILAIFIKKRYK